MGDLAADPDAFSDRFSAAHLIALAARTIRELADLGRRSARARQRLATFSLHSEVRLASPAAMQSFATDLARAVARVVARHHDERSEGGRRFRLLAGTYPAPAGRAVDKPPTRRHRTGEEEA